MNHALLHSEVQQFIRSYTEDTLVLAFKGSPFPDITIQELIVQIEGYRKTKLKLPKWHSTEGIYFSAKLHIEQTSSERTARYKAELLKGNTMADLTGGLGVDSYYFAEQFEAVDYFEMNAALKDIAAHNFKQLNATNIHCNASDSLFAISDAKYDVIYVDPARRHASKGKVFFLKDCEPNVIEHADYLMERCDTLMVKTSPMLDISSGLGELKQVQQIHIVAVDNEVKELLWILEKKANPQIKITTINISKKSTEEFSFNYGEKVANTYSRPKAYLYEPNAAIMKAGAFSLLSEAYKVLKLHQHSHLFTSEQLVAFPGRTFKIEETIPYRKNEMKSKLMGIKANISTRNFPGTVAEIRKKWKIKDGGETYLFFTTLENNDRIVLICSKINDSI